MLEAREAVEEIAGTLQKELKDRGSATDMSDDHFHDFQEGDRVAAHSRPNFPRGTVVKRMDLGFVLVRWDGDVLETAHFAELTRVDKA
jgi:hypothetical protein